MWFVRGDAPVAVTRRLEALTKKLTKTAEPDRTNTAARLWKDNNKASNKTFVKLRRRLEELCPGSANAPHCAYCEDSRSSSIDHIWPKSTYPLRTFVWDNLVYACENCQLKRGHRWEIIGEKPRFLDVRQDDPSHFFLVDLLGTFWLAPRSTLSEQDTDRAYATIHWLDLNGRGLPEARRRVHDDLLRLVRESADEITSSAVPTQRTEDLRRELVQRPHRSVWLTVRELAPRLPRWRTLYRSHRSLFDLAPWNDRGPD